MRLLFIHQNFPGQYKHIAEHFAARQDTQVVALGISDRPVPRGVRYVRYKLSQASTRGVHPLAADFEAKVIRGQAAARAAQDLKRSGFTPDIICAHPGWGEALFIRDVWPAVPILSYFEFYYRADAADIGFDPEFPSGGDETAWSLRAKNAAMLASLVASDQFVTPTRWQGSHLPHFLSERLNVIHDGIDTRIVRPKPATVTLGRTKTKYKLGDEIITFVNRNLEPYRGYHTFMRALPHILSQRPNARAIIVGGDGVSYGAAPAKGSWKTKFLAEVQDRLDMSRVHFVGSLPYDLYLNLLNISAAHVYLTYPFVLSWSMLEAMASQCLVIASRTPPVSEVIQHEQNGLLFDFFSPDELAQTVIRALDQPSKYQDVRAMARQTIEQNYDLYTVCLPQHVGLIERTARA